jgi:hypothetical protein
VLRRGTAAGLAIAGVWAILVAVAPVTLGSPRATASADDDTLVAYLPAGKIKVGKRISYRFQCLTACQVTASSTLVLKGPNLGPVVDTGMFAPGEVAVAFLKLNKPARVAIKAHLGSSKLRTSISASNAAGATDTDTRTFRFRA